MENCKDMTYHVGSHSVSSPMGSLELSKDLLRASTGRQPEEGLTNITHLPGVLVGAVLCRLSNPVDVASAFVASRVFWGVAQAAPFRLKLRPSRLRCDELRIATWTRTALTGIRSTMGSTQELDLAGSSIFDEDVAALLVDLPSLELLILDGCQKLTSHVADAFVMCIRSGPRALSLQRCFRLGPAAAGNLLSAAAAVGSRLQTLLLSHLDRIDLHRFPPIVETFKDGTETGTSTLELAESIVRRTPGIGLRILALHNCSNLGASELAAVAETCPYLEIWMLGGSTEGLGLSRPDFMPPEKVVTASSALLRAAKRLSRLRILEVTFFSSPVIGAIREQMPSGICVWDFCEEESVATAARLVAQLKGCSMPSEGEEYPLGSGEDVPTPDWFIDSLRDEQNLQYSDSTQLAEPGTVESRQGSSGYGDIDERWSSSVEYMLLAFKAGTNCSDYRRKTPLHIVAARGDAGVVANLLFIGASAGKMKDSGGATPLFLAAESGHAQVCDLLLKGGADVLTSNRTGETPLYISALRGHSAAVEVMLAHCHEQGVNWQDAEVYGDGWTPLMAATVADRQAVAQVLLDFALASNLSPVELQPSSLFTSERDDVLSGRFLRSTETPSVESRVSNGNIGLRRIVAPPLVDAQNRYGQTALHIAARKASTWFVDHLLHAGASLDVRDEYGSRPIDVARKLQHSTIEETLKRWQNMQAKSTRASTSGKSSRKRKSKQKKVAAAAEEQRKASTETQAPAAPDEEKMRADGITLEDIIVSLPGEEFPVDLVTEPSLTNVVSQWESTILER